MTNNNKHKFNRRQFLKQTTVSAAALTAGLSAKSVYAAKKRPKHTGAKKMIVIGIDGMDPRLSEMMMDGGKLPNFAKLRALGGYKRLGTSTPPQSPVAWANFITGAGPGSHGIFDFIHRDLQNQCHRVNSIAYVAPGQGAIGIGDHALQLTFWPFNHTLTKVVSGRKGTPFWEYLDRAGIPSYVYMIPSNYPPTPSKYGYHFSLSGMGTSDITGSPGTYHYFSESKPIRNEELRERKFSNLAFKNDTAQGKLHGCDNYFLKKPESIVIKFLIHRDRQTKTAVIEIQNKTIMLKEGQWSGWVKLDFEMSMPVLLPNKHISGICRFYLQKVTPKFQLYVSPVNIDPADPVMQISEPSNFSQSISENLGSFPTLGFQERFNARDHEVLNDEEYAIQANMVLEERLKLLEYALEKYEDGLLFFYFSSTDLQAHIFWWDSLDKHPVRLLSEAKEYHNCIKELYKKMDDVLGSILSRYGNEATILALSDHGFSCLKRKFNVNLWLRDNGYINPPGCTTLYPDEAKSLSFTGKVSIGIEWSKTRAYGLGLNGLYLNLKGREPNGVVEPGQREELLEELVAALEAVRDEKGKRVIRKVYRSDQIYSGPAIKSAPDLIIGYYAGYLTGTQSARGQVSGEIFWDNKGAWSADHCFDPREVPGVLFCNKPVKTYSPMLTDMAATILTEFGLEVPSSMEGKNIF